MFKFSNTSLERMAGINPRLIGTIHLALKNSNIDFGIPPHGGIRSEEEQNLLFHNGKSLCDGYIKKSKHQTGDAVDVYAFVNGKASWDEAHLTEIACVIKKAAVELGYKIKWGGDWENFKDLPHFELES